MHATTVLPKFAKMATKEDSPIEFIDQSKLTPAEATSITAAGQTFETVVEQESFYE